MIGSRSGFSKKNKCHHYWLSRTMEEKPWNNYWKLISDITGHQNKLLEIQDGYFNTWSFGNLQVPFNSERTLKLRLT